MKIAFISPRVNFSTNNKELNDYWSSSSDVESYKNIWSGSSISLLILAALTPKGYTLRYIDENHETVSFDEQFDLVAITAMTQQAERAFYIGDEFKKRKIKVIIGGIHASILPNEVIPHADSVVVGEAEYIWQKILEDLKVDKLQQIYYSEKEVNLVDSPIPRYDLLNPKYYKYIWIQASRGCPHDCEYCASSKLFGKTYRLKSIDQIVNEINFIKSIFPEKAISFADDNLFVLREHAFALVKKLHDLKIIWQAQTDIGIGEDNEMLEMARRGGCSLLFIGLESLTEESLRGLDRQNWKLKKLKNYSRDIQNIQRSGIGVMGSFIVGLDGDDSTVFDKIGEFVIENNLFNVNINILTPLPGTRLRERLEKENRLLPLGWEKHTGWNVTFIPKKITIGEIESGIVNLYRLVYSKDVYYKKMQYFKCIQRELLAEGKKN
jgi:radical SAM superfamily enzyme YgiQ (UPF0313 family)